MTMTNDSKLDLTANTETIGAALLSYGYKVAKKKGLPMDALEDAALAFAQGAWESYLTLDLTKTEGDGVGYVYQGGLNGLIGFVRFNRKTEAYAKRNGTEDAYKAATAKATVWQGDYAPADLSDNGEGATIFDMLADPKAERPDARLNRSETIDKAKAALATLDAREQRILLAQAEGATLREIGKAEGVSAEAVRKIINKARDKAQLAA